MVRTPPPRAAVERSEVHRLDKGGEVAGPLAGHRSGCQRLGRKELEVQQCRIDQLAVVAEEQRVGAENLQEQRLLAEPDHDAALAFQRVVRPQGRNGSGPVVLERVHVLEEGAGG